MIDSKELMIGNYINDAFGGLVTVRGLTKGGIWIKDDGFPAPQEAFAPIPLTPEILEKCGFSHIPHFTVMSSMILDVGRGRMLSIGSIGTPNEMLFIHDQAEGETKIDNIVVLHNWDYDGPLYLHKLHNIISLFKPELTITL